MLEDLLHCLVEVPGTPRAKFIKTTQSEKSRLFLPNPGLFCEISRRQSKPGFGRNNLDFSQRCCSREPPAAAVSSTADRVRGKRSIVSAVVAENESTDALVWERVTEALAADVLALPMHPYLDSAIQDKVVEALKAAL